MTYPALVGQSILRNSLCGLGEKWVNTINREVIRMKVSLSEEQLSGSIPPQPNNFSLPQSAKGEKTARRVLRLLNFISEQGENVTAKTISCEMDVSLATAYNLINSLIQEGYVERVPGRKGYRLGPMISLLYQRTLGGGNLITDVDSVVEELAERTRQRTYLALYKEDEVVVVQIKHMPGSPKMPEVDVGFRDAGHALALGKVLLANHPNEKLEALKDCSALETFTSRTITDPRRLEICLNQVRSEGFATDLEEFVEGFCCIAAPVYGISGDVEASIGISAPSRRFRAEPKSFVHSVLEAGREASIIRGYTAQN